MQQINSNQLIADVPPIPNDRKKSTGYLDILF